MDPSQYVNHQNLAEKTKRWMNAIAPYNSREREVSTQDAALLVIDMQKFFLTPGKVTYTPSGMCVLPNIKSLIMECRLASVPVYFTRHGHFNVEMDGGAMKNWWADNLVDGSDEAEIHDEIKPTKSEKTILKRRYSGFYQTDLELSLRGLGRTDLIITGIMTNLCCESTARDAFFRDFNVFFVADGTGATDEDLHLSSLRNIAFGFGKVTTTSEILTAITAEARAYAD